MKALKEAGMDARTLADRFPRSVEMTLHDCGVIAIVEKSEVKYVYAGEGNAPVFLKDMFLPQERKENAPFVMGQEEEILYLPIQAGQEYTCAMRLVSGVSYERETTEHPGYLYGYINRETAEIDAKERRKHPGNLLEHPEWFERITFQSAVSDVLWEAKLYAYFTTPAGTKTPLYYGEKDHDIFPCNKGYARNDGEGHCVSYAGPYRFIRIGEGERFMELSTMGYIKIGETGDSILLDEESGRMKIITKERAKRAKITLYLCDRDGEILGNSLLIKDE